MKFFDFWHQFFINLQKAIQKAGSNSVTDREINEYDKFLREQAIRKEKNEIDELNKRTNMMAQIFLIAVIIIALISLFMMTTSGSEIK